MTMLYEIRGGSVSLGGEQILDHIHFQIKDKEKVALTGRNGTGKTTLLRLIAGEIRPDCDDHLFHEIIHMAEHVRIGMLSQNPFPDPSMLSMTVRQMIEDDLDFYRTFTGLGFTEKDREKTIGDFSGGERTKIALARLLVRKPDLLLLDEPDNHLDVRGMEWLEDRICNYPGAVLMVSHDRYFLDRTAQIVYELKNQKLTRYPGNYTAYKREADAANAREWKAYKAQQKEIKRLRDLIDRFKHKPSKASMARSKKKILEKMTLLEKPRDREIYPFTDPLEPASKGPRLVLESRKAGIGYRREELLFCLDISLKRGRKIGIIGGNGSGKSTLLKTIRGEIPNLSGSIRISQGVQMGYFSQHGADRIETRGQDGKRLTVLDHFRGHFPHRTDKELRTSLGHYLFPGPQASKYVDELSGGERSRLLLAELLEERPNFLLLDEPDNHMDIPAKETIEAALKAYGGTLMFVTHDRYFLNALADSLLLIDSEGVRFYPFGYDHYQYMVRKRREGDFSGVDPVEAENTHLVESLLAVPKKERHQTSRFNTEQSYTDWQLILAKRQLDKIREEMDRICHIEIYDVEMPDQDPRGWEKDLANDYYAGKSSNHCGEMEIISRIQEKKKALLPGLEEKYTQICLIWYDRWMEYQEAFADYR